MQALYPFNELSHLFANLNIPENGLNLGPTETSVEFDIKIVRNIATKMCITEFLMFVHGFMFYKRILGKLKYVRRPSPVFGIVLI